MYTLLELLNFTPLTEKEKEYYNFDERMISTIKSQLENDRFWLGGQIKMRPNDIIDLSLIQKVKDITEKRIHEYGGPCNSFEAASISNAQKQLGFIELMIKSYNLIIEIRSLN